MIQLPGDAGDLKPVVPLSSRAFQVGVGTARRTQFLQQGKDGERPLSAGFRARVGAGGQSQSYVALQCAVHHSFSLSACRWHKFEIPVALETTKCSLLPKHVRPQRPFSAKLQHYSTPYITAHEVRPWSSCLYMCIRCFPSMIQVRAKFYDLNWRAHEFEM